MIKKHSYFKSKEKDEQVLIRWILKLELKNGYNYEKISIQTSLGKTQVYGLNVNKPELETLVIFPGYRTTALIWDLDKGLFSLSEHLRIFLVETNGQPNLSDGYSPDIKSLDYGKWGAEVFKQLNIESANVAGASFGGLVCMKISLVIPDKIQRVFLLNPACFRMISFSFKNIFYNLLPLVKTTDRNIQLFLDKIVFHKPEHKLSGEAENMFIEYLRLAISRYKDNTEKPYYMGNQLNNVSVDIHLLVGENDMLIPPKKSIHNAKKHLKENLKNVHLFKNVGHGIECYKPCIDYIKQTIKAHNRY